MSEGYDSIIAAGGAIGKPNTVAGKGGFAVVPDGYGLKDIEAFGESPRYIKEIVEVHDADSFSAYFNRFKSDASVVFADAKNVNIEGVLDYHASSANPAFGSHVVRYPLPRSREWLIWTGQDGKYVGQSEFARFIEENRFDIRKPDGADILEIARRLDAKKKVEFTSGVRLQSGDTELTYNETTDASASKGKLHVPEMIVLGIPVFEGDDPYEISAFLRYRINEGKLNFKFDLHRADVVLRDALDRVIKDIETTTSTSVWRGRRAT